MLSDLSGGESNNSTPTYVPPLAYILAVACLCGVVWLAGIVTLYLWAVA